ncbi:(2Fe-2S)-binding protein [Roseiarcaceae bacterium H3SJ34-1]|uniref:(2Fe-2S)-binding protein n=1 Tax=Terripilifer ovatus TaxID=3032367 RepID=UPI003AB9B05C|nr:(2Fe-2S)-binding protein [Roseiarcaceae bacterium H3SJ34-1]
MPVLKVNGQSHNLAVPDDAPLLYVLRNDLKLNGPKFGCGLSQCGACTVLIDGQPVRSCVTSAGAVVGQDIVTLEGLGTPEKPHRLQRAFIDEQAAQCGYCANGMIMRAKALLDTVPKPSEGEVRLALDGNLCRCGVHQRIISAVMRASREA